ncbi:AT-rich interactive domain-containing protein 5B-like isoform X1 [Apis dorsata]|uniref:AT-rich interactive domain-containing protein 5B-like isoform X1 n=1 Tax=Apis dorsata TaxID=7462 RepID=UPI0012940372|nr:AT-rich interactive domain-containing protein 5B-like isoform X1 [Apis dorsata]
MEKIELLGGACFSHGPYTFYKAVRIGNGRVLRLGSFFLTKLWSDADLVSIGELQLLWMDSRGPNQPLASLRLYFLPENTPDGRRDTHGEGKEKGTRRRRRRRRGGGGGGGRKKGRRRKKKAVDADLYVVLAAFIFSGFYSKPYLHSHYFFASLSLKFL